MELKKRSRGTDSPAGKQKGLRLKKGSDFSGEII